MLLWVYIILKKANRTRRHKLFPQHNKYHMTLNVTLHIKRQAIIYLIEENNVHTRLLWAMAHQPFDVDSSADTDTVDESSFAVNEMLNPTS